METQPQTILLAASVMMGLTAMVSLRVYFIEAPPALRMLSQLWMMLFAFEVVGFYTREGNVWIYNLFNFFRFFFLAYIYFQVLERELVRITIQIFYGAFIVFMLINSFFLQGIREFQSLTFVVGGVFVIYLAGAYFWQLLVSPDNEKIMRDPFFWLSFGLVVSLGGSVPFYGMFNYLQKNFYDFTVFYHQFIVTGIFSIFLNVLVMIAFLCRKNYPNPKSY
jgi:hypothetical protein